MVIIIILRTSFIYFFLNENPVNKFVLFEAKFNFLETKCIFKTNAILFYFKRRYVELNMYLFVC